MLADAALSDEPVLPPERSLRDDIILAEDSKSDDADSNESDEPTPEDVVQSAVDIPCADNVEEDTHTSASSSSMDALAIAVGIVPEGVIGRKRKAGVSTRGQYSSDEPKAKRSTAGKFPKKFTDNCTGI
jgi:hypothetical protein